MLAEPFIQRLCTACLRRSLLSTKKVNLQILNSLPVGKNVVAPVSVPYMYHRRSFVTSLVLLNKADELDVTKNPFFEKYQEKLKHLQESDPEEFESRIAEMQERKKPQKPLVEQPQEPLQKMGIPGSSGPRSWPPRSLDEIMKVELLKDLDTQAIDHIWKEHHLSKDCVFSVVPDVEYDELYAKSKISPNFLFTLPKGDGYEFYLCQFNGKDVYFTPLGMYQLVKENAPPCLVVAHFPELKEEKGIVLMAGEYDRKVISKAEALNLVKQMALYYGRNAAHRHNLVRTFNTVPDKFQYMDIVEEYKKNQVYLEENPY